MSNFWVGTLERRMVRQSAIIHVLVCVDCIPSGVGVGVLSILVHYHTSRNCCLFLELTRLHYLVRGHQTDLGNVLY